MLKTVICFIISANLILACSSDCLECHPKLKQLEYNKTNKYYNEHHFLINCNKCHKNHPSKNINECGADCFECHSRQKLIHTSIPAHQKLNTCVKCHKNTINELIPNNENYDFLNFEKK